MSLKVFKNVRKIVYIGLRDSFSHKKGGGTPRVGSAGLGFRELAAFLR